MVRVRRRVLRSLGFYSLRDVLRLRAFRRDCRKRGTRVHHRARLYGINRITIGNHCVIDTEVILSTTNPVSGAGLIQNSGEIVLGARCVILSGVVLAAFGGCVTIGEDVDLMPYTVLLGSGGITIGSKTMIAPQVTLAAENHLFESSEIPIKEQGMSGRGIKIGSDVWIGAGARILDGVTIGDGAVVGAGAVVTRSVDPYSVVVGVPGRRVGIRSPKNSESPGAGHEMVRAASASTSSAKR